MDKKLLDIICCPTTKLQLELLAASRLDELNAAIRAGAIKNQQATLQQELTEALITSDGHRVYPVRDGIPVLLEEECIDWIQETQALQADRVKLDFRQLESRTAKGLSPFYLVSCDEPLLVDEALAILRAAALAQGYTERERHSAERYFDWDELAGGLQALSLFAEKRLIELRLPTGKPGNEGSRFFVETTSSPPPDTVFVVITPALNKASLNLKWVKTLLQAGDHVPLYAPRPGELPAWLNGRLAAADLKADREALQLLAAQVEGNLLAAKQEIDKLALIATNGHVDADTVRKSVADGARFDVFQLGDAALAGKGGRVARILYSLENEGIAAPLVLWSLVRECLTLAEILFRIAGGQRGAQAMKELRIWDTREGLYRHACQGRDSVFARRLVTAAGRAERIVKGSLHGQPWNALMELAMLLAGGDGWQAEIAA